MFMLGCPSPNKNHSFFHQPSVFRIIVASLVVQTVKHLPTMQETQVQSLGQKDPLEKEMPTHSSTFAWKIPWMEEHGRLQSMESLRVVQDCATSQQGDWIQAQSGHLP